MQNHYLSLRNIEEIKRMVRENWRKIGFNYAMLGEPLPVDRTTEFNIGYTEGLLEKMRIKQSVRHEYSF